MSRVNYDELRSLSNANIGTSYVLVGSRFAHPVCILEITNTTDADLYISFDGNSTRSMIPAKAGKIIDYNANKTNCDEFMEQAADDGLWVKQIINAPTIGALYCTVIYSSIV